MMPERGEVAAIAATMAVIKIRPDATCTKCAANCACGTLVLGKLYNRQPVMIRAKNTDDLKVGEQVQLTLPARGLLLASAITYLLPLLTLFLGALLTAMQYEHDVPIALGGGLGLVVGFMVGRPLIRRLQSAPIFTLSARRLHPAVARVRLR